MLIQHSKKQLHQLQSILNQISEFDYLKTLEVLENSSIGKHVRHILEFYECLFNAIDTNSNVCYDDRKRNLLLEENVRYASDYIIGLIDKLNQIDVNKRLLLKAKYEHSDIIMETSLFRELTYTIEHTVHHLAIIRIGVNSELKYIRVSDNFGYAESTINYLQTQKIAS